MKKEIENALLKMGVKETHTTQGKSTMTAGNYYNITLTKGGQFVRFQFHDNIHNDASLCDFVYALLMDANAYESTTDAFDFMAEFGYTNPQKAKEVYNACKKQAERLNKLFTSEEVEQLQIIFENY